MKIHKLNALFKLHIIINTPIKLVGFVCTRVRFACIDQSFDYLIK